MSLVFGATIGTTIALAADSSGIKIASVPQLQVALAWIGYFNKSPGCIFCPDQPENLQIAAGQEPRGFHETVELLLRHLNSLDHVHGQGRQAIIFIAGFLGGQPGFARIQANGNRGSWVNGQTPPPCFTVGCLEPLGFRSEISPIGAFDTLDAFADFGVTNVKTAETWLRNNQRDPIIAPPLVCFHSSNGGNWNQTTWA